MNELIKNKKDMERFITADLKSLGKYPLTIKERIYSGFTPTIWKYELLMRKLEYSTNCTHGPISKLYRKLLEFRFINYGNKLGGGYRSQSMFVDRDYVFAIKELLLLIQGHQ